MPVNDRPVARLAERVDVHDAYALNVWARYFNVSEQSVKDAVMAAGDDFYHVSRQLNVSPSAPAVSR
jgi:Protein of unknown function (DUF3606)